ncbi:MAG: DUF4174 domain-containing protein [Nonlabens sp.]
MNHGFGQELSEFKWENRLLVILSTESNISHGAHQLKEFDNLTQELADRKLRLLKITPDSVQTFDYSIQPIKKAKESGLWSKFASDNKEFEVMLIGLDGGIKFRSKQLVNAQDIFDRIDSMPMRKSELDKK